MSFAAWTFLFGVIAVAGPVLAHFLAKPRYKRVPFTMLQFLKSSQIESHSRRHLRDLLILFLRCAIIIMIAFLFAQPIIFKKTEPKKGHNIYYLGLDDSASMAYKDGSDSYFEQMKDSAIDYIVSAKSDAVFNICSLVSGNWNYGLGKQQALAMVQSMNIKTKRANLGAFISGISGRNNNERDGYISAYVISDFTESIMQQFLNIQEPAFVDNIDYKIITSSGPVNNASIISADASDYKNNTLSVNVTINNNGQTHQNRNLYAIIEKEKIASFDIDLNPGQSGNYPLVIEADFIRDSRSFIPIELILTPYDNLIEDDKYYLAVQLPKQSTRNVLLVETEQDEMFLLETAVHTLSETGSSNKYNIKRIPMISMDSAYLRWANIFVCPKIPDALENFTKSLSDFIDTGGRAIFFLTDEPVGKTAQKLWQQKILPALPVKCIKKQIYLEIKADSEQLFSLDNDAVKALSNYRIDKIPLYGYWDCQNLPESACLWRYQNDAGFIYYIKHGSGTCILVNSSLDNSLGSLLKSSASAALCQCLLGEQNKLINSSFACDEKIILPIDNAQTDKDRQKQIMIQNCNGQKQLAAMRDTFIMVPESDDTGWIKTLGEPILYAGINLPPGETNITKPSAEEIDSAIRRVFSGKEINSMVTANGFRLKEKLPVWKYIAWVLIALLIIESFAANRMKR
ncbi:MAG: BatA domain-containing protein [Sedimentisphaerales bacterium]|nr:BatA domain-containing protein [Sedimentisphaerales bacterium]